MLRALFRRFDRFGEILVFAGMISLTVTVAVSMVDIVGRKLFAGFTITGMDDIVPLTVMTCVCLAMPLTYLREGHVGVEFLTDRLPPRALAALKFLVAILNCGFVAAIAWFAWRQAAQQVAGGIVSNTLAIPIAVFWAPLAIGLAISVLASLILIARYAALAATGRDPVRMPAAGDAP